MKTLIQFVLLSSVAVVNGFGKCEASFAIKAVPSVIRTGNVGNDFTISREGAEKLEEYTDVEKKYASDDNNKQLRSFSTMGKFISDAELQYATITRSTVEDENFRYYATTPDNSTYAQFNKKNHLEVDDVVSLAVVIVNPEAVRVRFVKDKSIYIQLGCLSYAASDARNGQECYEWAGIDEGQAAAITRDGVTQSVTGKKYGNMFEAMRWIPNKDTSFEYQQHSDGTEKTIPGTSGLYNMEDAFEFIKYEDPEPGYTAQNVQYSNDRGWESTAANIDMSHVTNPGNVKGYHVELKATETFFLSQRQQEDRCEAEAHDCVKNEGIDNGQAIDDFDDKMFDDTKCRYGPDDSKTWKGHGTHNYQITANQWDEDICHCGSEPADFKAGSWKRRRILGDADCSTIILGAVLAKVIAPFKQPDGDFKVNSWTDNAAMYLDDDRCANEQDTYYSAKGSDTLGYLFIGDSPPPPPSPPPPSPKLFSPCSSDDDNSDGGDDSDNGAGSDGNGNGVSSNGNGVSSNGNGKDASSDGNGNAASNSGSGNGASSSNGDGDAASNSASGNGASSNGNGNGATSNGNADSDGGSDGDGDGSDGDGDGDGSDGDDDDCDDDSDGDSGNGDSAGGNDASSNDQDGKDASSNDQDGKDASSNGASGNGASSDGKDASSNSDSGDGASSSGNGKDASGAGEDGSSIENIVL